jgi:hypothetical protein
MVLLNFGGVCIVSKFSDSLIGSIISLFSAFSNALYLFALSRMSTREGNVDMPLMLGKCDGLKLFKKLFYGWI